MYSYWCTNWICSFLLCDLFDFHKGSIDRFAAIFFYYFVATYFGNFATNYTDLKSRIVPQATRMLRPSPLLRQYNIILLWRTYFFLSASLPPRSKLTYLHIISLVMVSIHSQLNLLVSYVRNPCAEAWQRKRNARHVRYRMTKKRVILRNRYQIGIRFEHHLLVHIAAFFFSFYVSFFFFLLFLSLHYFS